MFQQLLINIVVYRKLIIIYTPTGRIRVPVYRLLLHLFFFLPALCDLQDISFPKQGLNPEIESLES